MPIQQFVVDAFTSRLFRGNPAAVCPLDDWLPDDLMQAIAAENNLSETAFFVAEEGGFRLRWFTPKQEVTLCGHATLASAHVLFDHLDYPQDTIRFTTRSGELTVQREGEQLAMVFPASRPLPCDDLPTLQRALGGEPLDCLAAEDYLVVYPDEAAILAVEPDYAALRQLDRRGVIITAPGDGCDFVSRFFAPNAGIDEDPVTGSAHCQLAPYWAQRLGQTELEAIQVSPRRGKIHCRMAGPQVTLIGAAVTFLRGEILVDR